jgi:DNA-binding MarR family transcriptional regulator
VAPRIINVLDDLSAKLGVPVITPEYEIVLRLIDSPNLTAQALLAHSSLSSTGFFATLNRLKHLQVVTCSTCGVDKRSRLYSLTPEIAELIVSRFSDYKAAHDSFASLNLSEADLHRHGGNVRPGEKINHLTCEYQILLYLYLRPALSNSELARLVDASATKFNTTLKELLANRLIRRGADPGDRRRKRYEIPLQVRSSIEAAHHGVFAWLESKHEHGNELPRIAAAAS